MRVFLLMKSHDNYCHHLKNKRYTECCRVVRENARLLECCYNNHKSPSETAIMHYSGTPKGQVLYHAGFDPQNSRLLFSFFSTHTVEKKFVIIIA